MAATGGNAGGLAEQEAQARLHRFGPNVLKDDRGPGPARLLARQFASPLVLILVFGAVVSLLVRDLMDAGIIIVIVVGSTLLGFYQEYRASAAVLQLRQRLALTCRVRRDGAWRAVPAREVVPGDVFEVAAGNLIPADGLILEARDFLVSEASLTGESFPVEKTPGVLPADTPMARRSNAVFVGSSVRSGTATVLAVRTGAATAYGAVAARLRARPPETDFARGIRRFGYLLVRVMIGVVLFVLIVNYLLHRPFIDSLLFAVALAVGISPELLPAIMSVTLAAGARDMARRGVIVRHLESIENFGGIDILCTDKTGTLTLGVVALDDAVDPDGTASNEVRRLAFVNAVLQTGIENPLDAAIVAEGKARELSPGDWRKIDEIPYDFLRKRLTIVVAEGAAGSRLMITKGAFDHVLPVCTTVRRGTSEAPLDREAHDALGEFYRRKSVEGFRVLALATRELPTRDRYARDDEAQMCFAGFLLFFDPPKPGVDQTLRNLAASGISTKIISGDNGYVTAHLAAAIGLDASSMLTGAEIARMKEEALWHLAPRTALFVDVDPQQKERIVRALQHEGHSVGYLGDGINDAPALHAADVGISVDGAVDVARESADLILLERDLDVLCEGVQGGRRTFANTLKYISISISANFGNMVSMALATPFLPYLPMLAKQILLNNFLTDLPAVTISTDNVDPEQTAIAQRWRVRDLRRFMILFGLISSVFDVVTFSVLLLAMHADERTFQTAWFVISVLTELVVLLVLRTARSSFASRPGRMLLWTVVATAALALALPYAGELGRAFGFARPGWPVAALAVAVTIGYVVATEAGKRWFYRR
ncbi:MAG: magnesium-translocating P-type ATPase [Alphaproteobacteria bacterium]|nr:magnesium-translocating P-type ATPase [Alphaproteobacteria bacterium]